LEGRIQSTEIIEKTSTLLNKEEIWTLETF
jgi:hypothetical protein